jgi:hypothetical protein
MRPISGCKLTREQAAIKLIPKETKIIQGIKVRRKLIIGLTQEIIAC